MRIKLGAALLGLMIVSGCGQESSVTEDHGVSASDVAIGSNGDYFFDRVQNIRTMLAGEVAEPRTLSEALPASGGQGPSFADLAALGTVTNVSPGNGRVRLEDDEYKLVPFDDPQADERDMVVTVAVKSYLGPAATTADGDSITFRMGVLADSDADAMVQSLGQLTDVVILLEQNQSAIYPPWYWSPILNGAGIGVVDTDGKLDFPGLGKSGADFTGSISSASALRQVMEIRQRK